MRVVTLLESPSNLVKNVVVVVELLKNVGVVELIGNVVVVELLKNVEVRSGHTRPSPGPLVRLHSVCCYCCC